MSYRALGEGREREEEKGKEREREEGEGESEGKGEADGEREWKGVEQALMMTSQMTSHALCWCIISVNDTCCRFLLTEIMQNGCQTHR